VSSFFKCSGKFAGVSSSRFTPGGIKITEFMLSCFVKIYWKPAYYSNLLIKAYDKTTEQLEFLKTGSEIYVEGLIEGVGKDNKINLIANLIKEEK